MISYLDACGLGYELRRLGKRAGEPGDKPSPMAVHYDGEWIEASTPSYPDVCAALEAVERHHQRLCVQQQGVAPTADGAASHMTTNLVWIPRDPKTGRGGHFESRAED